MPRRSFKSVFLNKSGTPPRTKLIAVRLPEDLKEKLESLAKAKGTTFSHTLIEALRYALEEDEQKGGKG